jgi:hypothetical protein
MAIFDQRGQKVTYQYNAAGDINFGAVHNRRDLVGELGKLYGEMAKAIQAGVFDEAVATEADYQVKKAVQEAKKSNPDKTTITSHLSGAKTVIEGVTAASGLVTGLVKAIEVVKQFF